LTGFKILGDPEEVNPEARRVFQKAEVLREKGKNDAALRAYREAVNLDNGFIRAHYWILKLTPKGDLKELTPEVKNAAARVLVFGTPAEFEEIKGLLGGEAVEEITGEIIGNYETFASVLPDDYDVRYELACFLGRVRHSKLYVQSLEELIEGFPDRDDAYITLYFHYEGENPEKASAVREKYAKKFGKKALKALDEIAKSLDESSGGEE
jgi:tetratricopeptide (TPR) repeat protein